MTTLLILKPGLVLMVDDNVDLCDGLCERIEMLGWKTIKAYSGKEATIQYSKFKPNISILDVSIPDMSGYEVSEKIFEEDQNAKIVLMSAYNIDIDRVRNGTIYDYLTKPFGVDALIKLIQNCVENEKPTIYKN